VQCLLHAEMVEVLERNVSTLFTTAKLEIARKDAEIVRLRGLYVLCLGRAVEGRCGLRNGCLCMPDARMFRLLAARESIASLQEEASSRGPGPSPAPPAARAPPPRAYGSAPPPHHGWGGGEGGGRRGQYP
jgi:hypothetical protein